MDLSPSGHGGDDGTRVRSSPPFLALYLAVVCLLGLAGIGLVLGFTPWSAIVDQLLWWPTLFLAVAAVVGEVKPIRLVLGAADTRSLSTSAPFVLALVAVAGVGVAVIVQALASIADDVLNRREFKKSLFNTSQYALSVIAAGAVYNWITGVPVADPPLPVTPAHIGALLIAGVVMVAVNWALVAGVVSLAMRQPLGYVLRTDAEQTLLTNLVLLSVGGIAAGIAASGIGPLLLLAGPVVAAHLFAATAARHAHEATHDSLTGLGNRGQVDYHLHGALEAARQSGDHGPGLVLLDLDHFKDINDTLGHPVGDRILREVAQRLLGAAPEGATVHRLGGDEFAVVITDDLVGSREAARAILAALDAPIQVEKLELLVRASAGVAVAPVHGSDAETLMKNADIALYHAKVERDRISTYSRDFDVNTVERLQLLADLRTALDGGQLNVVYQPQVDLTDGRTVAVEALVRWHHPVRGLVRPDDFIPLAENSGLIFPVTSFVLDSALRELATWRAAGHDVRVSVNLSARHLSDLALVQQVSDALQRHRVPAQSLVLEVTETGIFTDAVRADAVLRSVRALGVEIAIDDYGTGNASLSYLRRLEVDELKVDRSFVSAIGEDDHDYIIVRSTIELALALGLRVVAEGVEDAATVDALARLGRVIAQGYHLGMPGPPEDVRKRLDAERAAAVHGAGGN